MSIERKKALVAIVGLPNVGKSSLFNRIIGRRKSIVSEKSGTTRDQVLAETNWLNNWFWLVDTAGMMGETMMPELEVAVEEQIEMAMREADLLYLVVDAKTGFGVNDEKIIKKIYRPKKNIILVINKAEGKINEQKIDSFRRYGIKDHFLISAINGSGVGDLLDFTVEKIKKEGFDLEKKSQDLDELRVCLIGRPNVGKSSLFNVLCGQKKRIVSEKPGTTRDVGEVKIRIGDQNCILFDTAGLRRAGKMHETEMELVQSIGSIKALQNSDIAVLMIDFLEGLTKRDMALIGMVLELNRGIVLFVNKWDEKNFDAQDDLMITIRNRLKFVYWMPVVFGSAKNKINLDVLLNKIITVGNNYFAQIDEGVLEKFVLDINKEKMRANLLGIKRIFQIRNAPPTFMIKIEHKKILSENDERMMENLIRDSFELTGVPVKVVF